MGEAGPRIVEALRGCELFSALADQEVRGLAASLVDSCEAEEHGAGDVVFAQGELCRKLCIIAEGQVLLQRSFSVGGRTATTSVALLGKGRVLGCSALLYGPRQATASAVCQKATRVLALDASALRFRLEAEPALGFKVMERLACLLGDRLQGAYRSLETHV